MSRPGLGVAVIGYSFMGKAHSNAWRNVGAFYPDVPRRSRQQVLVGRDPPAVKEAADRYGWAESATDWRTVIERDDIDIVDICTPGHLHAEIAAGGAGGRQARAGREAAGQHGRRVRARWSPRRTPPAAAACMSMVGFNYRRVPGAGPGA